MHGISSSAGSPTSSGDWVRTRAIGKTLSVEIGLCSTSPAQRARSQVRRALRQTASVYRRCRRSKSATGRISSRRSTSFDRLLTMRELPYGLIVNLAVNCALERERQRRVQAMYARSHAQYLARVEAAAEGVAP